MQGEWITFLVRFHFKEVSNSAHWASTWPNYDKNILIKYIQNILFPIHLNWVKLKMSITQKIFRNSKIKARQVVAGVKPV